MRRWERDAAAPPRPVLVEWLTHPPVLAVIGVAVFVLLLARLWVLVARAGGDPAFSR